MIRTGFSLACLLAGAMTLGVEGLPMVAWGINLVSAVLWGFATFGAFTLLRRGGLV